MTRRARFTFVLLLAIACAMPVAGLAADPLPDGAVRTDGGRVLPPLPDELQQPSVHAADRVVRPRRERRYGFRRRQSEKVERQDEEQLRNREPEGVDIAAQNLTFLGLTQSQWLWIIISVTVVTVVGLSTWQLERRKPFLQKVPRAVRAIYIRYNAKSPDWLDRWVRWSEVTSIERAFHSINQCLSWLRKPQPAAGAIGDNAGIPVLLPFTPAVIK
jgi:hypothetical protein